MMSLQHFSYCPDHHTYVVTPPYLEGGMWIEKETDKRQQIESGGQTVIHPKFITQGSYIPQSQAGKQKTP